MDPYQWAQLFCLFFMNSIQLHQMASLYSLMIHAQRPSLSVETKCLNKSGLKRFIWNPLRKREIYNTKARIHRLCVCKYVFESTNWLDATVEKLTSKFHSQFTIKVKSCSLYSTTTTWISFQSIQAIQAIQMAMVHKSTTWLLYKWFKSSNNRF